MTFCCFCGEVASGSFILLNDATMALFTDTPELQPRNNLSFRPNVLGNMCTVKREFAQYNLEM